MKKLYTIALITVAACTFGQIKNSEIDLLAQKTLKEFDVPGMSIGVIKDGKVIYAQAHGTASLKTHQKMNTETLVGIASNSKGFTAVALAILADEGKLDWNDKVTQYIPEFQMYDPFVSKEVTIKDLIIHRTGLGLGQGDLMFFPEGGTLSIQDIVYRTRFLQPKSSFRNQLNYNNIAFIIAGEVITRITGKSWAEFVEENIMKPVGMKQSYGSYNRAMKAGVKNIIDAHAPVEGKAVAVPHDWNETANAAGGIVSNIPDMLTWAECLINGFVTKNGKKLVSDKQIAQLWQIQQPSTMALKNPYDTQNYGYGLGWFISDVKGYKQVQHTGGLIGTVTQFTLIPDLKLGIVVLTNQQNGAAFNTITNTIKDAYLNIPDRNWLNTYSERMKKRNAQWEAQKKNAYNEAHIFAKNKNAHLKPEQFIGTYTDAWFGDITISQNQNDFRIQCATSPRLKGTLLPYSPTAFIVKWDDRSYDADAYLLLELDEKGIATGFKLKPISDATDFSFDFEDLDLKKVKK